MVERARQAASDAPPESRDAFARLELKLVFQEVGRSFGLATLLPSGMARISLAMGTAFAVLCFSRASKDGLAVATLAAVLAFAGGIVGSGVASRFGQRARSHALAEREAWKRALLAATRELGSEPPPDER